MSGLVVDRDASLLGTSTATFSPDRLYRYALTRSWDPRLPVATFVMLNPSTADAFAVDPTVRRCLGFARAWRCGSLTVLNLFGLRSTDPAVLRGHTDPIGDDNDATIAAVLAAPGQDGPLLAAWGSHGPYLDRDLAVVQVLLDTSRPVLCLGETRDGQPRHPLYIGARQLPVPYRTAG